MQIKYFLLRDRFKYVYFNKTFSGKLLKETFFKSILYVLSSIGNPYSYFPNILAWMCAHSSVAQIGY